MTLLTKVRGITERNGMPNKDELIEQLKKENEELQETLSRIMDLVMVQTEKVYVPPPVPVQKKERKWGTRPTSVIWYGEEIPVRTHRDYLFAIVEKIAEENGKSPLWSRFEVNNNSPTTTMEIPELGIFIRAGSAKMIRELLVNMIDTFGYDREEVILVFGDRQEEL